MARKTLFLSCLAGMIIAAFILLGYPYFFRDSLAEPQFDIDPAEGKVWLNSQIILEFRGYISKEEIDQSLKISPDVSIIGKDLKVEHIAKFPWHQRFPWAKTKIIINPQQRKIFAPETKYQIKFANQEITFQTITLPRVVLTIPKNGKKNVKTYLPIKVIFNEEIQLDLRFISIDPEIEVSIVLVADTLFIQPRSRLENSTTYTVTIKKGLKDKFDHPLPEDFVFSFTTKAKPKVVKAEPSGNSLDIDSQIKIVFEQEPERSSVEESFTIKPEVEGSFQWKDDLTFLWKPNGLDYSTVYQISLAGKSLEGDPIASYQWSFETKNPPPPKIQTVATLEPEEHSIPSPQVVKPGGGNKIILTFDDSGAMGEILDILANYGAKAIFFPYGKWANTVPSLIQRAINEGHLVCNHSYSHADLSILSPAEVRKEILGGAVANCNLLRPPYGEGCWGADRTYLEPIASELGFKIYCWDIDTLDWLYHNSGYILNTVLSKAFPGAIVLIHMRVAETLAILPTMIEKLQAAGYLISW